MNLRTMLGLRETGMELKWIDTRIKKEKKRHSLIKQGELNVNIRLLEGVTPSLKEIRNEQTLRKFYLQK